VETIGSKRSYALIWCMPNNDDDDDVVCCWCFSKEPELSRELQLMLRCDGNKLETVPLSARRRNRMHDSNMEIGKI